MTSALQLGEKKKVGDETPSEKKGRKSPKL